MTVCMEFIKKHYEKVLLGLVLLGLIGVAVALLIIVPQEQQDLDKYRQTIIHPPVKPLPPVDMALEDAAWKRLQSHSLLDLTTGHKTLNPVLWQLMPPDNHLRKIADPDQFGLGAVRVAEARPIYFVVNYSTNSGGGYLVGYGREATAPGAFRASQDKTNFTLISTNNKSDKLFTLTQVVGSEENTTELQMILKATGEPFTLTPSQPFRKIDSYTVNLIYPPDTNVHFEANRRKDDILRLEGEDAKIDSISDGTVVILSLKNGKRYTLHFPVTTR
jgi:hypothetical protein